MLLAACSGDVTTRLSAAETTSQAYLISRASAQFT